MQTCYPNRDVTSMRQDIDSLHDFWQKRSALVQQQERQIEFGGPDVDQAEVRVVTIELSKDFPETWKKINSWKKSGTTSPQSVILDLSAPFNDENPWNLHADYASVKVLKVCFMGANQQGQMFNVAVNVSHPGFSSNEDGTFQVLKADKPITATEEQLQVMGDGQPGLAGADVLENLGKRWVSVADGKYRKYKYEGYNFKAQWRMEFKANAVAKNMEKFYMVFALQTTQRTENRDSEKLQFPYRVSIRTTRTSPTDSYTLVCSEAEYKRVSKSIQTALKNGLIESGTITPITNGNSTEVYVK